MATLAIIKIDYLFGWKPRRLLRMSVKVQGKNEG